LLRPPGCENPWAQRDGASSATRDQWGYLHEAMEVDGTNALELLFTPCNDQDVHTLFLQPISQTDPQALHVILQEQAGFHLPETDSRLPANVRPLPEPGIRAG